MTTHKATLDLSIPNRIPDLAGGMDAVEAFLASWSVDPGDAAQVMIIVDEIASNIIKAAWPGGGDHQFRIGLHLDPAPGALTLTLLCIDDGVAFDPTQAAAPDLDLDLDDRMPGGLGLFMVREMTDTMEYARTGDENRLTLTKRLQLAG